MTAVLFSEDTADPWLASGHPEAQCQRCDGPNVWSWFAPSPLWNAVMRDPETGDDAYGIVCPVCFAELAALKGIGGSVIDGLPRWTWRFAPDDYALSPASQPDAPRDGEP